MHCVNEFRKSGLRLTPASMQWRGTLSALREGETAGRSSAVSFVSGMKGIVSCAVRASGSRSSANFVSLQPVRLTLTVNAEEVVLPAS